MSMNQKKQTNRSPQQNKQNKLIGGLVGLVTLILIGILVVQLGKSTDTGKKKSEIIGEHPQTEQKKTTIEGKSNEVTVTIEEGDASNE